MLSAKWGVATAAVRHCQPRTTLPTADGLRIRWNGLNCDGWRAWQMRVVTKFGLRVALAASLATCFLYGQDLPLTQVQTPSKVSPLRSEEHTSEFQSLRHLVCRLL